jgi:hypothetical protein
LEDADERYDFENDMQFKVALNVLVGKLASKKPKSKKSKK